MSFVGFSLLGERKHPYNNSLSGIATNFSDQSESKSQAAKKNMIQKYGNT